MTRYVKVDPKSTLADFIRERVAEKNEVRQALTTGNRDILSQKGIRLVNPLRPSGKR
ncbi:hypothetical protein [Spirosoma montaniterrae]|uniref:hypothetical protein n=1 Tax=Spirosoma montaniterrae TaxID=1178516 RepID=UPI0018DC5A6F|nr:hypothetical protein [Spirosoma montaniterrae]